jgi:uncharacterized membrane protein YgcG
MLTRRWILAIPLVLASLLAPEAARAAIIRDQAGLFSAKALSEARAELDRIERDTKIPITIETIPSLEGRDIHEVLERHAVKEGDSGLYILIPKKEHKVQVESSVRYRSLLTKGKTDAIRDAFVESFKKGDFDAGLTQGVRTVGLETALARSEAPATTRSGRPNVVPPHTVPVRPAPVPPRGGGFGLGSIVMIGLLVVGVLFVLRLLGGIFGGARRRPDGSAQLRLRPRRRRGRWWWFHVEPLRRYRRRHGRQLAVRPVLGPEPRRWRVR